MAEISNTPYAEPSMTPSQANQVVSSLGINPNDVLSSANVSQTITNPAPIPTDLLGIRENIYNTLGVNDAQSAYDEALGLVNTATGNLRTGLQQLSNRPVSLSKITGQQGQLREVAGNEIQALADAANLKLNTLNALKAEADTQFAIREGEISQIRSLQAQYPGANIKFGDSFDEAIKKIEKYTEKEQKKAMKSALKETARSLGIETSGLSRRELEREIGKVNKEALEKTKKMQDLEMETAQAQLNKLRSGGSNKDDIEKTGDSQIVEIDGKKYNIVTDPNTGETMSMVPLTIEEEKSSGNWGTAGKIAGAGITSLAMAPAYLMEKALQGPKGGATQTGQNYKDLWNWIWD